MTDTPNDIAKLIRDEREGNAGRRAWMEIGSFEAEREDYMGMLTGAANTIDSLLHALEETFAQLVRAKEAPQVQDSEKCCTFCGGNTFEGTCANECPVGWRLRAEAAEAKVRQVAADIVAAAGDLGVPLPEPGTDMARLLIANVLLKARVSHLEELMLMTAPGSKILALEARVAELEHEKQKIAADYLLLDSQAMELEREVARLRKQIADEDARSAFHTGLNS